MSYHHFTRPRNPVTPVCLVSAVLFSAAVVAADYQATFEDLDKDGNGYISNAEAASRPDIENDWKAIDKNGDNQLDITEFSAFEGKATYQPPEDSEKEGIGAAPYK